MVPEVRIKTDMRWLHYMESWAEQFFLGVAGELRSCGSATCDCNDPGEVQMPLQVLKAFDSHTRTRQARLHTIP